MVCQTHKLDKSAEPWDVSGMDSAGGGFSSGCFQAWWEGTEVFFEWIRHLLAGESITLNKLKRGQSLACPFVLLQMFS